MALAAAGGLSLEADTRNIEVTTALGVAQDPANPQTFGGTGTRRLTINMREDDPRTIALIAGDAVRVNPKFDKIIDKSVQIMGQVKRPGRYDLLPGDKLSDLLSRAGGLTQEAYAPGAIFSRAAERKAEEARFQSQARMIRQAIATQLGAGEEKEGKSPLRISWKRAP